jgi:hypothetical protein
MISSPPAVEVAYCSAVLEKHGSIKFHKNRLPVWSFDMPTHGEANCNVIMHCNMGVAVHVENACNPYQ